MHPAINGCGGRVPAAKEILCRTEDIDVITQSTVLGLETSNLCELLGRDSTTLAAADLGLHDCQRL